MEDNEIVGLFLQRDEKAIGEVQKKYGKRLISVSLRTGLAYQDAEEIVNETYYAAWNKIPPNEPGQYLFWFMAKIVREKSIDRIRAYSRKKNRAEIVELSDELESCVASDDSVEGQLEAKELEKAINTFLRGISDEKRNIFLRRYWFMDSVEDISARLSVSRSKVKTVLFRTRNELREFLKKEGYMK